MPCETTVPAGFDVLPTDRYVVVLEWPDGTVGTNGPYPTGQAAADAARRLFCQLTAEEIDADELYVYVQPMGRPYGDLA